jgi:hypothetical protein
VERRLLELLVARKTPVEILRLIMLVETMDLRDEQCEMSLVDLCMEIM